MKAQPSTFCGINVTPLTDVMLVLLITFLLTANTFQVTTADIPLPQVLARRELPADVELVAVDESGRLTSARLSGEVSLSRLREESRQPILALAVDRNLAYGHLYPLLESAEAAGWKQIVLLTEEAQP